MPMRSHARLSFRQTEGGAEVRGSEVLDQQR